MRTFFQKEKTILTSPDFSSQLYHYIMYIHYIIYILYKGGGAMYELVFRVGVGILGGAVIRMAPYIKALASSAC